MKHIPISKEVWKSLIDIRRYHDFKNHNQAIEWLLDQVLYSNKDNEINRILGKDVFRRLEDLRDKNNLSSIDDVICALIEQLEYYKGMGR